MADSLLRVTDEQVAAARLRLVLDDKLGRQTPELVRRIAAMTGAKGDEREGISSHKVRVEEASPPQIPRPYETDCREVLAEAWLFLDDESNQERRELLERHLDECSSCREDFDLKEHLRALLARKGGGDHAVDALKQRLRQSIREIMLRQAVLGAEVTVEQGDDGTILEVRLAGTESRVPRLPGDANL
jgi:mycothiol system anti-sigma-R factor